MILRSIISKLAFLVIALEFLAACQTVPGGPPRDKYVGMPKDLLRLKIDQEFYGGTIDALSSTAEVAWTTNKGAQGYYERVTFGGTRYLASINLRMLPKGWYWTVPESVHGLQEDLDNHYGHLLGKDIRLGGITTVRTGFPRSFYARFSSKGRDCAGVMIASNVGTISYSFRNTVVGFLCASAGSSSSLAEETIQEFVKAITIDDPYYNGEGFSDEQIDYFKGKQRGVVLDGQRSPLRLG